MTLDKNLQRDKNNKKHLKEIKIFNMKKQLTNKNQKNLIKFKVKDIWMDKFKRNKIIKKNLNLIKYSQENKNKQ